MTLQNPPTPAGGGRIAVIPLATALYVSEGLIFSSTTEDSPSEVFRSVGRGWFL